MGRQHVTRSHGRSAKSRLHRRIQRFAQGNAARGVRCARGNAAAARSGHRSGHARGLSIRRGPSILGRGHRRHALCAFRGPWRAAQRVREDRGLRGGAQPDRRDSEGFAASALGSHRGLLRVARTSRKAGARLRCGELQYLSGPARTAACPTSSAASPTPTLPCATRRSSTISIASASAAFSARAR